MAVINNLMPERGRIDMKGYCFSGENLRYSQMISHCFSMIGHDAFVLSWSQIETLIRIGLH